jgi:PIN domain nuclease of toxin-antitoxin system
MCFARREFGREWGGSQTILMSQIQISSDSLKGWMTDDDRLPSSIRKIIEKSPIWMSVVTPWEMLTLITADKRFTAYDVGVKLVQA